MVNGVSVVGDLDQKQVFLYSYTIKGEEFRGYQRYIDCFVLFGKTTVSSAIRPIGFESRSKSILRSFSFSSLQEFLHGGC